MIAYFGRSLGIAGLVVTFVSCGIVTGSDSTSSSGESALDDESMAKNGKGIAFSGFIGGAFDVNVDGVDYPDMETFYSEEVNRLPGKVQDAGYDETWSAEFDAQVGLKDLWLNMDVYIAPESREGYQGHGVVARDGKFEISLPEEAMDATYKVRANKRISVVLRSSDESKKICYNFSAVEQSVLFSDLSKPIVMTQFVTRITNYACDSVVDVGTGVEIPGTDSGVIPLKIKPGTTKEQLVAAYGTSGLTIGSYGEWCWAYDEAKPGMCATETYLTCACTLTFDENNEVDGQYNIRTDLLEVLSW